MSERNLECLGCKILKAEVALLKGELAGRDAMIAELTERPGQDTSKLVIRGMNEPAKLVLAGPCGAEANDIYYRVSVEYWNLSATSQVAGLNPARFLACF